MPTVKQLQAEYAAVQAEINRLQQQNDSLLEWLIQTSTTTKPTRDSTGAVFRSLAFPSSWQLKTSTKHSHFHNSNLLLSKKLSSLNMLHSFLAKRLSLAFFVLLPPTEGLILLSPYTVTPN
ncbi:hypothetical protein G6F46_012403 [Rhizopus delemar]|nr:hypothetical protein G6F36_014866 [Rhizopus arrhizus]KAG1488208.1 hypothetical protein G6F54_012196 [Rhizopus delemar]KAG1506146.1 hypothetical protein G6F53_009903 [Rhizopus delemar]KAG1577589.1 hypothetical protein G6F48_012575 [Rhizopus delemar]KAG1600268.1 hypothetical protein G6F47_004758 [Rhizopus delemar]